MSAFEVADRTEGGHRVRVERRGKDVVVHWGCESRRFEAAKLKQVIGDLELLRRYGDTTLGDHDTGAYTFGARIDESTGELYVGDRLGQTRQGEHVPWDAFHDALQKALRARS